MTKNINYVSHKKSKLKTNDGKPQLPSASVLVEGEIAINYAKDVETLSIKNESGTVVTFSSDNYYTEQKLGSGFTGANSARTVTEVIEHDEEVTAAALNNLNDIKLDVTAYTPVDLTNYYTKDETSGKTEISNALGSKVNSATFTAHTADTNAHLSGSEKENLDALATNITAISGITSQDIDNWNSGAGVDLSNYYKKSETSGATELSTEFSNKASQSDLNALSGTVTGHTANTTIHVTSADKTAWNAKTDSSAFTAHTASIVHMNASEKENLDSLATNIATISGITSEKASNWDTAYSNNHTHTNKSYLDGITGSVGTMVYQNASSYSSATEVNTALGNKANTSDIPSVAPYADSVKYNSTSKKVEFYHGTTAGTMVFSYDASPFLIDGMVQDVKVTGVTSGDVTVTCLVISFNTDAGKQNINIPISQIFDASNYYTKSETSGKTELSTAFSNKLNKSDFNTYSGGVDTAISNKASQSDLNTLSGTVTSHTSNNTIHVTSDDKTKWNKVDNKQDSSGMTAYTLTSTTNTLSGTVTAHTADTSIHFTTGDVQTQIDDSISGKVDTSTFNTHTGSSVHMTTTEKTNLDSLATNITTISGITSTKVNDWNKAATSAHNHTNKVYLDTVSGNVGTMAYENTNSYSSATEVETALSGKQASGNYLTGTTKYAGSSTQGGAATSAEKLTNTAAIGSGTQPVFFTANGVPSATTYSLSKSVPSDAVFTDTTYASGNFITITGDNNSINVTTGTSSSSVARGDHNHDAVYQKMSVSGTAAQLSAGTDTTQRVWTAKNLKDGMDAVYAKTTDVENMEQTVAAALTDIESKMANKAAVGLLSNSIDELVETTETINDSIEEMEQTLAAGLSDVNERMAEKSALNSLASTVNDIRTTGISPRRLARKDFTSYGLTWFINTLKKAVADQDLEKYGMKVGDYIKVTHDSKTYNYVIAGLNTMRGSVGSYRLTQSHVGIIVDTNDTHAWNASGNTYQSTNTYSTGGTWTTGASAAGYANCDLHYYLTTTVLSNVESDLGSANLLSHYKLYGNSINTTGYNRFGSDGGCTNSWAWYANQKICALSEIQVYGSIVWSSSGRDTGEACRQLDVFRVYNMNEIFEDTYPWLRDVASASNACRVGNNGAANYNPASHAEYVAALILFA